MQLNWGQSMMSCCMMRKFYVNVLVNVKLEVLYGWNSFGNCGNICRLVFLFSKNSNICLFVHFYYSWDFTSYEKENPDLFYSLRFESRNILFALLGLCTVLPGVPAKSMSNLIEPMILGGIWGVFLFVRLILVLCNFSKYKIISHCGNALVFIISILFAYFFPSLPEWKADLI